MAREARAGCSKRPRGRRRVEAPGEGARGTELGISINVYAYSFAKEAWSEKGALSVADRNGTMLGGVPAKWRKRIGRSREKA